MLRRCRKEDRDCFVGLNREFMLYEYEEGNAWENPLEGDLEADFEQALNSPCTLLFVIEEEDEVVGFMNVQCFYSFWAHGKVLFLDDFFLAEGGRGKGYGRKALGQLEDFGRKEGYRRIQLLSEKTNPRAVDFYRKNHYKEQELHLFIKYL